MKKGYIQIYTGEGKGKTTAAVGLAIRALAADMRVFFCQFLKGERSGELEFLSKITEKICIRQCGLNKFCVNRNNPGTDQIEAAKKGFELSKKAILSGNYDLVILDEINVALYFNLLKIEDVLHILKNKPSSVEIVLTGRNAPEELYDYADLISEIREIKHYFQKGVKARKGIEY